MNLLGVILLVLGLTLIAAGAVIAIPSAAENDLSPP